LSSIFETVSEWINGIYGLVIAAILNLIAFTVLNTVHAEWWSYFLLIGLDIAAGIAVIKKLQG